VSIVVTVGSALVGLLAALFVLLPWWRKSGGGAAAGGLVKGGGGGGRNWKNLSPFGSAFAFGTLCSVATGGLLGTFAHRISQGSSSLGGHVLSTLTGSQNPSVQRHGVGTLTPGGAVVLILLLVGIIMW
jgi:hypothetical protein